MTTKKLFLCCALLALLATPVLAQISSINAACDYWFTPDNGAKLTNVTIPAGLLCNNQDVFYSQILMKHHPVANTLGLANVDTVIMRPLNIPLIGGIGTGPLFIMVLSLESTNYINVPCGNGTVRPYRVYAYLDGPQQSGSITYRTTSACGGQFDASFDVYTLVKFEDASGWNSQPIPEAGQTVVTTDAWWSLTQGSGGIHNGQANCFDTAWDMQPDTCCPGNPNSYPGWKPPAGCSGPPTPAPTGLTVPLPQGTLM